MSTAVAWRIDCLTHVLIDVSYFGKQEGDFSLVLKSICARKTVAGDERRKATNAVGVLQVSTPKDTDAVIQPSEKEPRTAWFDWFSGRCTIS